MLTDSDLRQRLNAAREFEHSLGRVTFGLRILPKGSLGRIYAKFDGPSAYVEALAEMLSQSVLWVRGATIADVGLVGDEPLPETPLAAREYLAEHPEQANELAAELWTRAQARFELIECDLKNSASGSATT